MKIAVIGAGSVGAALAGRFAAAGHDVVYGVRRTADPSHAGQPTPFLQSADAARGAEIVVLATPWQATEAACGEIAPLAGKIVIDCTNPLGMGPDGLALQVGFTTSGGEMVASWCPGASVFKTFNQTGYNNLADPGRLVERPVMFVAGDDEVRKSVVLRLVADTGFDAADAGPLRNARLLEPLAMLWIDQALARGRGRDFAFAITRMRGKS